MTSSAATSGICSQDDLKSDDSDEDFRSIPDESPSMLLKSPRPKEVRAQNIPRGTEIRKQKSFKFLQYSTPDEISESCDACTSIATFYCNDCRKHMCRECEDFHQASRKTRDHTVDQITVKKQAMKSYEKQRIRYCEEHSEEPIKLYCQDCRKPLCNLCRATEHSDNAAHKCIEVGKAAEKLEERLTSLNDPLEACISRNKSVTDDVARQALELQEHVSKISDALKKAKEMSIRVINSEYDQMQRELDEFKEGKLKKITGHNNELEIERQALENFKLESRKLIDKRSHSEVCLVANDMIDEGDSLINSQNECTTVIFDPEELTFTPASISNISENDIRFVGVMHMKELQSQFVGQGKEPMLVDEVFVKLKKNNENLRIENSDLRNKGQQDESAIQRKNEKIERLKKEKKALERNHLGKTELKEAHDVAVSDLTGDEKTRQPKVGLQREKERTGKVETAEIQKQLEDEKLKNVELGPLIEKMKAIETKSVKDDQEDAEDCYMTCDKMEFDYLKVDRKKLDKLEEFLYKQDWALQSYVRAGALHIAVKERHREKARRSLREVKAIDHLPIKFVEPCRTTLHYTMLEPSDAQELNSARAADARQQGAARDDSMACPLLHEIRPSTQIYCLQTKSHALACCTIRSGPGRPKYLMLPAHVLKGKSLEECIISMVCSKCKGENSIGRCFTVYEEAGQAGVPDDCKALEDIALIRIDDHRCKTNNIIRLENQIEYGIVLSRDAIKDGTVVCFIDQDGQQKTGKIFCSTFMDKTCYPQLYKALAITCLEGEPPLEPRLGDSGALVVKAPPPKTKDGNGQDGYENGNSHLEGLGMLLCHIKPVETSNEFPASLTIANNFYYVLPARFGQEQMEIADDRNAVKNQSVPSSKIVRTK